MDTSHLDSLRIALSNERCRLASATSTKEIELRKVYVSQLEKEVQGEMKFLGITEQETVTDLNDDDLLNELFN